MNPDEKNLPKTAKEWIELTVPLITGGSAIGSVVLEAIPLPSYLRALAIVISLPACFLAYLSARRAASKQTDAEILQRRAWLWLAVFGVILLAYYLFVVTLNENNPTGKVVNVFIDFAQVVLYGAIFAAVTISLTNGVTAWFRRAA